jgi:RNA polymerase sigma factor (sigma-70 family)
LEGEAVANLNAGGHSDGSGNNNSSDTGGDGGARRNDEELMRRLRVLVESFAPNSVLGYSFDEHFKILSEVIRRIGAKKGLPPHEIDDVIQEVWVAVLNHLPKLQYNDNQNGLRAWFIQVVRSKVLDALRRKVRRPAGSLEEAQAHGFDPADESNDVAADLDREWVRHTVHVVLQKLNGHVPESYCRVLSMRFLDGRSVSETAEVLGVKSSDVWNLQHRALGKFQSAFNLFLGRQFDDEIREFAATT